MWTIAFGILCGLVAYAIAAGKQQTSEVLKRMDALDRGIEGLADRVSTIGSDVESTLPLLERQKRHFDAMPHLRIEQAKELEQGDALGLNVFDYSGLRRIEFVFERLEFRSQGEKDAVAYGKARISGTGPYSAAKIFFNQHDNTAKLLGEDSSSSLFFADGGSGYVKCA